mgnify:CR=1 FL=1|tara:strand:- start:52154 stop:53155 length:1002 start_codon:yes stop_codon:yes gene_type:complete
MSETYKKKDFVSDQEVKWCPGCGDYAILAATQMAMAQLGIAPHKTAVISGIGCSSRFPYYMNTYGMHTIHGRAPGFVTGLKLTNPELSVWMITGDGDGLSIGGNHLAHIIRRNIDVNIILFNNEIYGLTKGQYSPTSQVGLKTKSTPFGSLDRAFSPMSFAMGAGATFFARTMDTDPKHMIEVMKAAHEHKGTSVIEVFQNCVIFNDKVHDKYTNRKTRDDHTVRVEHGKPLIFGKEKDQALRLAGLSLETMTLEENNETLKDEIHIHDETDKTLAFLYSQMNEIIPMGVLLKTETDKTYDQAVHEQIAHVKSTSQKKSFKDLLYSGDTWEVK